MHSVSNSSDTFCASAAALLGPKGFTQATDDMQQWLTDWRGRYTGRALAMASPASTREVSDLLKLCSEYNIPVVPQGGNSGMCGGATPDETGTAVMLSLRRMNAIRSLDPDAGQCICDAGVILQTLHEAVEKVDRRFPLTLGGKGSATIGGLVSTNAGGTQVLRHGTMRDQVLGIEAVLADGRILNALTSLKKDNRGFDLKQLLIGSEGTLGVITAVNVQILAAISDRTTAWVGLASVKAARALLLHLQEAMGDSLEGFEIIPHHCLESVLNYLPGARSPLQDHHQWHALIECVASDSDDGAVNHKLEDALSKALAAGLIDDATLAANEHQADAFWGLRDTISAAERAIGPAMQHDISVPVAQMPEFITYASTAIEAEFPSTKAAAFGHLGDGNVHFHVLAPANAQPGEWESSTGKQISARVHDLVTDWGGSISAEHGIGQMKVDELARLGDPVSLSVMRSIKQALDPKGLLNPGKLVPNSEAQLAPGSASA